MVGGRKGFSKTRANYLQLVASSLVEITASSDTIGVFDSISLHLVVDDAEIQLRARAGFATQISGRQKPPRVFCLPVYQTSHGP